MNSSPNRFSYCEIKNFLGQETARSLYLSFLLGLSWFAIESSFLFILQGFLQALNLLNKDQIYLPSWYPIDFQSNLIILIIFGFLRAMTQMLKNHLAAKTQYAFIVTQRTRLLKMGLLSKNLIPTKELINLFGEIVFQSGNAIYGASLILTSVSSLAFFTVYGLSLTFYEMLLGLVLLAIFMFPFKSASQKISVYGSSILEEGEQLNHTLISSLKNQFLLTIYNLLHHTLEEGDKRLKNYQKSYESYSLLTNFFASFPQFIGIVILTFVAFFGKTFFHTPSAKLLAFFYIFLRLTQNAGEMAYTLSVFKLNYPGLKRLYHWHTTLYHFENLQNEKQKMAINAGPVAIKISQLYFRFNEQSDWVIRDLNLELNVGETLVIKGDSGVGKSTLLSLILGNLASTSGDIFINNHSAKNFEFNFSNNLAYVGPEPFMIPGTVKENLLYGNAHAMAITDAKIDSVLELLELKKTIEALPKKCDEMIFDIPQLSTGQKQRLSIARALLRSPSFIILDEATANLDQKTEEKILEQMATILQNCTTIIVTHKNTFDRFADKELFLKRPSPTDLNDRPV